MNPAGHRDLYPAVNGDWNCCTICNRKFRYMSALHHHRKKEHQIIEGSDLEDSDQEQESSEDSETGSCQGRQFSDTGYASHVLAQLAEQQSTAHHCDVTFIVEGQHFPAHRSMMILAGEYFAAMLGGNFRENKQQQILLEGISAGAFQKIMSYIYSGQLEIGQCDITTLYQAADFLQMGKVQEHCVQFLSEDVIQLDNCLEYLLLAHQHCLFDIKEKVERYICLHLEDVSQLPLFVELPYEAMYSLMGCDALCCPEVILLQALCTWLKHHSHIKNKQKRTLVDSLQCRLLCGDTAVEQLFDNYSDVLGERMIRMLQKKVNLSKHKCSECGKASKWALSRRFYMTHISSQHITFVPLGVQDTGQADQISHCQPQELFSAKSIILQQQHFLYVLGGGYRMGIRDVYRFNLRHQSWVALPSMLYARCGLCASALGDKIVVVGGRHETITVKQVEIYSISKKKWQRKRQFKMPVFDARACTVNGVMYVVGGQMYKDLEYRVINNIHAYDEMQDKWTNIGIIPKHMPGVLPSVCSQGNYIYMAGKYTNNKSRDYTGQILTFDVLSKQLSVVENVRWLGHGYGVLHSGLFYFLRDDHTIMVYHLQTKKWVQRKCEGLLTGNNQHSQFILAAMK